MSGAWDDEIGSGGDGALWDSEGRRWLFCQHVVTWIGNDERNVVVEKENDVCQVGKYEHMDEKVSGLECLDSGQKRTSGPEAGNPSLRVVAVVGKPGWLVVDEQVVESMLVDLDCQVLDVVGLVLQPRGVAVPEVHAAQHLGVVVHEVHGW